MISIERKRSERSQRADSCSCSLRPDARSRAISRAACFWDMLSALQAATRETDVTGWHTTNSVVGVMFTEIVLGQ